MSVSFCACFFSVMVIDGVVCVFMFVFDCVDCPWLLLLCVVIVFCCCYRFVFVLACVMCGFDCCGCLLLLYVCLIVFCFCMDSVLMCYCSCSRMCLLHGLIACLSIGMFCVCLFVVLFGWVCAFACRFVLSYSVWDGVLYCVCCWCCFVCYVLSLVVVCCWCELYVHCVCMFLVVWVISLLCVRAMCVCVVVCWCCLGVVLFCLFDLCCLFVCVRKDLLCFDGLLLLSFVRFLFVYGGLWFPLLCVCFVF